MAHPAKTLSVHSDGDKSSSGSGIRSKQEAASEIAGRIVIWKQGRNTAGRDTQSLTGRRTGATPGKAGAEQRVARDTRSRGGGGYSADFAALLRSNAAAGDIARIKSPGFAASLSHGHRGTRRRSIALGTALACVLAAGAGAALWNYGGQGTARAPELGGTLIVADRGNAAAKVAAPDARTADLVELDAPAAIAKEIPVNGRAQDPFVAPAPLSGGPLQAAIDGAPFRSSILGISTAALPVGSGTLTPTGSAVSAVAAPSASAGPDDAAALSTDAPPGSSLDSGRSDLGATMPSSEAGLPFGGGADEPWGSSGHRESNRSDYIAAFTRDAFRSSATVAAIGGSLKPNPSDEADGDLNGPASGPAASVAANGDAGAADGGGAPAGANHGDSGQDASGQVDGSSKADNDAGAGSGSASAGGSTGGSGAQASAGDSGHVDGSPKGAASASASAGGSTSGSGAQASAADSGPADGSSKAGNPGSSGSNDGPSAGPGHAASSGSGAQDGGDSDSGNTSQGKSDQAGKSKGSGSDGDAHGKQKGGDPHDSGKESGGQAKSHDKGGKDHGGKGEGGKGHGKG